MSLSLNRVTDKNLDICIPMLAKAPILGSGLYMCDRVKLAEAVRGGADILIFQDGEIPVGITRVVTNYMHGNATADVYCDEDLRYCGAISLLESKILSCGIGKVSVRTQMSAGLEFMKDLGYTAEVRLRQHLWLDGKYMSVTEYGKKI